MKTYKVYTRRSMGLDLRVWRVMLLLCIASLGLLSYRFIGTKKCTPINFSVKALTEHTDSVFAAGESISFITTSTKEVNWDYGDNSPDESGQYVTHRFVKPGTYTITAFTSANCETAKRITIATMISRHSHDEFIPGQEIVGTNTTKPGEEEIYTCMVPAKDYEWSIPNYPKMVRTGSSAKFQFPGPGKYTVQVTLDNDRNKRFSKDVTVEAPVAKPAASVIPDKIVPLVPDNLKAPATIKIANDIFASYLAKVIDKKMTVADFDDYLCDKGDTKAFLNGNITTFTAVCEEISGKKKKKLFSKRSIRITSALMQRDKSGCVTMVTVNYE
jgi:hypothetical protein